MSLISPPELAYITDSLLQGRRLDGRSLVEFREIFISTGTIAQASGSARCSCGGTDVIVGCKLDVEDVSSSSPSDDGSPFEISLEVSQPALQTLAADPTLSLTSHVAQLVSCISYSSHPQLVILRRRKVWRIHIDVNVLSSDGGGNLYDVASIAVRAALWDLRIPRTRAIQYIKPKAASSNKAAGGGAAAAADFDMSSTAGVRGDDDEEGEQDSSMKALLQGGKKKRERESASAPDFELLDYEADAGQVLDDRDNLPLSVTLNLTPKTNVPFLDATLFESLCSPVRIVYTFDGHGNLRGMKQEIPDGSAAEGPYEIPFDQVERLLDTAGDLSQKLLKAVDAQLVDIQQGEKTAKQFL